MIRPLVRVLMPVIVAALCAMAPASHAHHSRAMFDVTRNVTYRGVVKEYRWQNPHSHIVVVVGPDAQDAATRGTWDIEASAIGLMTTRGWTRTTFRPGDPITVVAHPNRQGTHEILLFYVVLPDGTRLYRAQHRYEGEQE